MMTHIGPISSMLLLSYLHTKVYMFDDRHGHCLYPQVNYMFDRKLNKKSMIISVCGSFSLGKSCLLGLIIFVQTKYCSLAPNGPFFHLS